MPKTAEVVIIGGGINGCCTAYYLAKRGLKNLVLIEKGHIASGPTGRSSGVVRQHYSHEVLAAMARDSVKVWENFENVIGGDAGFVQCGVIFFFPQSEKSSMTKTAEMMQRIGIRSELLSHDDLLKVEPQLHADDIFAGVYEPAGGYADPALATNSFADAARELGTEIMQRTTVTDLIVRQSRIQGVVTEHGKIATERVVNIAGPWGAEIAAMAGVEIPIVPSSHAVVTLVRPQKWRTNTPVWGDLVNGWYFKPEKMGSIMVGSIHDIPVEEPRPIEDLPTVPSYDEIETYSAAVMKRFPVMSDGQVQGGWAGVYDVTPDYQPVIDRISQVEGFYCAVGFSGHGFKIGPAVGQAMAELVVEGRCSSYDLQIFRYSRFAEQQSSRSAYRYGIVG